ncbi:MAG: antibiotic biosynthesis monooxygenase [Bacteroidales bacterium]|jgi:quinol monooxygenase YgiN|nr:antibiotic biosynthesis monooxygenase [Bacteroidales bacterium]
MKTKMITLFCVMALISGCNSKNNSSSHTHAHSHGEACCAHGKEEGSKKIIGAQIFIKAEKIDEFLNEVKPVVEKSRAEAGCISYTLYQDPQDKTKFFVFEEWKNQAAVETHFATEHFKQLGEILNNCASSPAVITIYDSTSESKV